MADGNRVPGEAGVWVLIGGDLLAFSLFFLVFSQECAGNPAAFASASRLLDEALGLANTVILLGSSLLVALGIRRLRKHRPHASALLGGAAVLGSAFVVIKLCEYAAKIADGITPLTSDFFLYYYAFTGIHLGHVLIGIAVLAGMAHHARGQPAADHIDMIECGGLFWHLVDLLWIMLFALFYLAARHG